MLNSQFGLDGSWASVVGFIKSEMDSFAFPGLCVCLFHGNWQQRELFAEAAEGADARWTHIWGPVAVSESHQRAGLRCLTYLNHIFSNCVNLKLGRSLLNGVLLLTESEASTSNCSLLLHLEPT